MNDDPHLREKNPSEEDKRTLSQISMYARNLLVRNASLFVFVVGIYGHFARIYRFDHAGGIASPSFNYTSNPEVLGEFYWRLVHPRGVTKVTELGTRYIVGSDTTVWPTTDDEQQRVNDVFRNKYSFKEINEMTKSSSSIQARLGDDESQLRTFVTLGEPKYVSTGLFSRATRVWSVLPLPLHINERVEVLALKDTWRARHRDPEVHNYNHIYKNKSDEFEGLAKCCGSVDLGDEIPDGHRTISMDFTNPRTDLNNRNHMRILLTPVGKRLDEFTSTHSLVEGIRDAIRGTQSKYDTAIQRTEVHSGLQIAFDHNVLHRDVSFGNVMLIDNYSIKGYLQDFDYSTFIGDCKGTKHAEEIDKELKDITVRISRHHSEFCIRS